MSDGADLPARLAEAEQTLAAIRSGDVDGEALLPQAAGDETGDAAIVFDDEDSQGQPRRTCCTFWTKVRGPNGFCRNASCSFNSPRRRMASSE